jgi:hypothetical protein
MTPGQYNWERTARTEKPVKDCQKRTTRTDRTELQCRTVRTGLPVLCDYGRKKREFALFLSR